MGRKAKHKPKQAIIALPLDDEVQTEAAYYARKCGITTEEALRIIKEANPPKSTKGATARKPEFVHARLKDARGLQQIGKRG
ncbi:hypothetical protein [Mesorhizobium sp. B2-4-15]|uniref:hypothetical protein n=1 Tax=Mesorhizobium sp. B2-4-15 TaxID=2589934 RepID=UPI0015EEB39F|nr:hypothetical protein [Mesorhizobium sp. B2-4-15]